MAVNSAIPGKSLARMKREIEALQAEMNQLQQERDGVISRIKLQWRRTAFLRTNYSHLAGSTPAQARQPQGAPASWMA